MAALDARSLSANDAHVLSALFDPESSPSAAVKIVPTSAPSLPHIPASELPRLQALEAAAIRPLNVPSPSKDVVDDAVDQLSDLIKQHPNYASAYANRAQALRLRTGEDIYTDENVAESTVLLADLSRAITLASPPTPQSPLSPLQAKVLSTAHSHRGYLLLKAQTAVMAGKQGSLPAELWKKTGDELEEMASRDFFLAGRYGDRTAQQMAVKTNPYAKMCGAIVKGALREEIKGSVGGR